MLQVQTGLTQVFMVGSAVIAALVGFIMLYIIVYLQKVNRFNKAIQEKEKEVYQSLLAGEEKERKRLAEELHDGLGAKLSGLKMNLEFLQSSSSNPLLTKTLTVLTESINELREISHNLQPSIISAKGLQNAITDCIDNFNRKASTRYDLFWDANNLILYKDADELMIYRIATELLHNAHKHAQASQVLLQVVIDDAHLLIMIEDDGIGFSDEWNNGIGFINIRERVLSKGGIMNIDSKQERGTTIIIQLPLIAKP